MTKGHPIHHSVSLDEHVLLERHEKAVKLIYAKKTESESYVVFPWDRFEFQNSLK